MSEACLSQLFNDSEEGTRVHRTYFRKITLVCLVLRTDLLSWSEFSLVMVPVSLKLVSMLQTVVDL